MIRDNSNGIPKEISNLISELYGLKRHMLNVESKIKDKIEFANEKIEIQNKTSYCYVVDAMEDVLNTLKEYEEKEK